MSKLSKKRATDIASLFNSIDVAGMMHASLRKKLDDGQITVVQYNEDHELWRQHAIGAARDLWKKYGILPVSLEEEAMS